MLQKSHIEKSEGELINLDSSHYVHDIEYKKIADEIEVFIRNLK